MTERLFVHPEIMHALRKECVSVVAGQFAPLFGIPIHETVAAVCPTGNIIAPDGTISPRTGWTWQPDRFTVYEECDLGWMMKLGLVREELGPGIIGMHAPREGWFFEPLSITPIDLSKPDFLSRYRMTMFEPRTSILCNPI